MYVSHTFCLPLEKVLIKHLNANLNLMGSKVPILVAAFV